MDDVALPTQVLGLDLSLTATGAWWGNPYDPAAPYGKAEIATPDRRKGESDVDWNARRFEVFRYDLLGILEQAATRTVVVEVTSHAYQVVTRGRGTDQERRERSTKGIEFRAGLGLGRALGWLDAVLYLAGAFIPLSVQARTIEAHDVKLRVAGAQAASKAAVAAKLGELWGWNVTGWKESEIDALACAVAWVRTEEREAHERRLQGLVARQLDVPRPSKSVLTSRSRSRKKTTV